MKEGKKRTFKRGDKNVVPNESITMTTRVEELQTGGRREERGEAMQTATERSMLDMRCQRWGRREVLYHAVSRKYCTSRSAPGRRNMCAEAEEEEEEEKSGHSVSRRSRGEALAGGRRLGKALPGEASPGSLAGIPDLWESCRFPSQQQLPGSAFPPNQIPAQQAAGGLQLRLPSLERLHPSCPLSAALQAFL